MHLFEPFTQISCSFCVVELGYSVTDPTFTLEERRKLGANVEHILAGEKEAARAPRD